jgi:hypothetical protein
MPILRTCVVARMDDGRLVIHSAIAMDEAHMQTLESWGTPAFLVVPSGYHRMDAGRYKERYPAITVLCPSGAAKRVSQVVPVDGDYGDLPSDTSVSLIPGEGCGLREGVMVVRRDDGATVVFNDLLFNVPHIPGPKGWVFRWLGSTGPPKVTTVAKFFIGKDRPALAEWMCKLADIPDLIRLIPGHGDPIVDSPADVLRQVADNI